MDTGHAVRNWIGCCCLFLLATPAWAQQDYRVEIEAFAGFTWSDGVPVRPQTISGDAIDEVTPKSGRSYGLGVGVFVSEHVEVGFQFTQQFSALEGTVSSPVQLTNAATREFADMKVNNYHGVFTYNFGFEDSTIRPFWFGGLGVTQYDPDLTVQTLGSQPQSIEGDTRFSTTWGGGVKVYPGSNVGITLTGRWTPTYINSSSGGIWCSPFWPGGCWQTSSSNYSHQLQLAGGVSFRF